MDLDQPAVGALEHAQQQALVAELQVAGCALAVDRLAGRLAAPVHRVQGQGAVEHRDVDVVAEAGDDAAAQAAEGPDRRQQRRGVVDRRVAEEDRALPAPAPLVHDPEVGGDRGVVAEPVAATARPGHRPRSSSTRRRRCRRPHRRSRGPARPSCRAGGPRSRCRRRPRARAPASDRRACPGRGRRCACPGSRRCAHRSRRSGRPARRFDDDHLCAVVGQQHGGHRAGHPTSDVEHTNTFQRTPRAGIGGGGGHPSVVTHQAGTEAWKNSRRASAISARTPAPEMTIPTMVSEVWVCPRAAMTRTGTPAFSSACA